MSGASGPPAPSWRPPDSRTRMGSRAAAAPNSRRAISPRGAEPRATATSGHRIGSIIHPVSCWVLITGPPYHWTPSCGRRGGRGTGRSPRAYNLIPCHLIRADTITVEQGCRRAARSSASRVAGTAVPRTPATNRCPFGRFRVMLIASRSRRAWHAHLVPAVDRVVRRDVELLVDPRPALVVGLHQVGVALLVGVVHLRDHAGERAVRPVAPEQGQRVEHVPEHPGVGEHQHLAAAEVHPAGAQELVDVGPDGAPRVAEVITGAEAGQQRRPPTGARQLAHVDEPLVAAVAERVAQRRHPDVSDPALVKHRALGQRPCPLGAARARR